MNCKRVFDLIAVLFCLNTAALLGCSDDLYRSYPEEHLDSNTLLDNPHEDASLFDAQDVNSRSLDLSLVQPSDALGADIDRTASVQALGHHNIILMIGDGMGERHRSAARWFSVGEGGALTMDELPARGEIETYSASSAITDSAAAATAIATGHKTNNGVIALDPDGHPLKTILEHAQERGYAVGLVTTTSIAHATPAAFVSHAQSRSARAEIASQLISAGVNVLFGGGERDLISRSIEGCNSGSGGRPDDRDLISEAIALGYEYICDPHALDELDVSQSAHLLGVFGADGMVRPHTPSLAQMTTKALEALSRDPDGFFLLVEGGQIDWASHANDAGDAIADTLDFDDAVASSRNYVIQNEDTLLIVTADHETGGMSLSRQSTGEPGEDGPFDIEGGGQFFVSWSTGGHTSVNVPVTAMGPLSEALVGVHDNTFIYEVMFQALNTEP